MTYLKRLLWLAAWSVWLWLGVGLYRELPRSLGPPVCTLPLDQGWRRNQAFLDDDTFAAVTPPRKGERGLQVRLFDAESGREEVARPLPNMQEIQGEPFFNSIRQGVLFGDLRDSQTRAKRFGVLDIVSGEWRELTKTLPTGIAIHPSRSWIAVVEGHPKYLRRVAVLDWKTGAELFSYTIPRGETLSDWPFFVGSDWLVLPLMTPKLESKDERKWYSEMNGWLEVWTLGGSPKLERVADDVIGRLGGSGIDFAVSLTGRVLFDGSIHLPKGGDKPWMDVYDIARGEFLSTKPHGAPAARRFSHSRVPWTIAPNGRAVLRYESEDSSDGATTTFWSVLVEVGTGELLWRSSRAETVERATPDAFHVAEEWHKFWDQWLPNLKFETRAWRSLDDGRVLLRTTKSNPVDLGNSNTSKTLFVTPDGAVHRLPLPVNWSLLALCQTILALPLILLWALLRWRRRRRSLKQAGAH